jgi:hypothetical protein
MRLFKHWRAYLVAWTILWVPLSFLWPWGNPHAPTALVAPLLGFISIGMEISGEHAGGHIVEELYFPWAVYWSVVTLIIVFRRRIVPS